MPESPIHSPPPKNQKVDKQLLAQLLLGRLPGEDELFLYVDFRQEKARNNLKQKIIHLVNDDNITLDQFRLKLIGDINNTWGQDEDGQKVQEDIKACRKLLLNPEQEYLKYIQQKKDLLFVLDQKVKDWPQSYVLEYKKFKEQFIKDDNYALFAFQMKYLVQRIPDFVLNPDKNSGHSLLDIDKNSLLDSIDLDKANESVISLLENFKEKIKSKKREGKYNTYELLAADKLISGLELNIKRRESSAMPPYLTSQEAAYLIQNIKQIEPSWSSLIEWVSNHIPFIQFKSEYSRVKEIVQQIEERCNENKGPSP